MLPHYLVEFKSSNMAQPWTKGKQKILRALIFVRRHSKLVMYFASNFFLLNILCMGEFIYQQDSAQAHQTCNTEWHLKHPLSFHRTWCHQTAWTLIRLTTKYGASSSIESIICVCTTLMNWSSVCCKFGPQHHWQCH